MFDVVVFEGPDMLAEFGGYICGVVSVYPFSKTLQFQSMYNILYLLKNS